MCYINLMLLVHLYSSHTYGEKITTTNSMEKDLWANPLHLSLTINFAKTSIV